MKGSHNLKIILSGRIATAIIVIVSILSRMIQLTFFYNMRDDASYQVLAMQNFINGHGITLARVFPSDLSEIISEPLVNWPPGYSFLLAPFYIIFNHNYIGAAITLDIVAAIALILYSRAILKLLDVQLALINAFTLLTSFFVYYFYLIASSDAIAISFYIIALYYSLKVLKTQSFSLSATLILTLCLIVCGYLKYLFIPAIFVLPAFFIYQGFLHKQYVFKKVGYITSAALVISIGGLLLYQKSISGTAAYISAPGRGFFPNHLLLTYPFFTAAFIKLDTMSLFLTKELEVIIIKVFQIIHLFFLAYAFYFIYKNLKPLKEKRHINHKNFFFLLFSISLVITALLSYLSLHVEKEEILPGWFWTYVEEPRYYGLATVMIHMGIFVLFAFNVFKIRLLPYLLVVLLLPEFFRGSIFVYNRIQNFNVEEFSWQYEYRFQKFADKIIRKERAKKDIQNFVVTGSHIYFSNRVSLYNNVPVLAAPESINDFSEIKTTNPVLLLVMIHDNTDSLKFKPFLLENKKDFAGKFDGYSFYTVQIEPN